MKLSECPKRSNNLQLLRFIAAVLVIVAHSFPLSTGESKGEMLSYITGGQLGLGGFAVSIFFCAGGYLIARSIERIDNAKEFFKARIWRLFPPLFVVVLISAFIMGPIVTEFRWVDYFKDAQVYKYLLNTVFVLQHKLPGVFLNNVYIDTVNGSLWTLPVEFLCYIACFIMWKLGLLEHRKCLYSVPLVLTGIVGIYCGIRYFEIYVLFEAIRPMLLFYMGILLYVEQDYIEFSSKYVIWCIVVIIISIPLKIFNFVWIVCFPYVLLYYCFGIRQVSKRIGGLGNISYGIYLCAFPIQQVIVHISGGFMNPFVNILFSIPSAVIGGMLLYIFIEKPLTSRKRI